MSARIKALIENSLREQVIYRHRRVNSLIAVIFFLGMRSAVGDETDETGRRLQMYTVPRVYIQDNKTNTSQSPEVRTVQPTPTPTPPPAAVRPVQSPIVVDPRVYRKIDPTQTPPPAPVDPRVVREIRPVEVKPVTPVPQPQRIDPKKLAETKRKLADIENQTIRVRQSTVQVKQQINAKQQQLARTAEPLAKQRLQMEIGGLQKQLQVYNDQLKGLEQERKQMMIILTTDDSLDFADTDDSLGTGRDGGSRWNLGGRQPNCFIATAAYGSPFAQEVETLRRFRDQYLVTNRFGRKAVDFYYTVSPPIAAFIAEHELLRTAIRVMLWPVVTSIKHPIGSIFTLFFAAVWYFSFLLRKKRLSVAA